MPWMKFIHGMNRQTSGGIMAELGPEASTWGILAAGLVLLGTALC